jgi:hypothetical protein
MAAQMMVNTFEEDPPSPTVVTATGPMPLRLAPPDAGDPVPGTVDPGGASDQAR